MHLYHPQTYEPFCFVCESSFYTIFYGKISWFPIIYLQLFFNAWEQEGIFKNAQKSNVDNL